MVSKSFYFFRVERPRGDFHNGRKVSLDGQRIAQRAIGAALYSLLYQ